MLFADQPGNHPVALLTGGLTERHHEAHCVEVEPLRAHRTLRSLWVHADHAGTCKGRLEIPKDRGKIRQVCTLCAQTVQPNNKQIGWRTVAV